MLEQPKESQHSAQAILVLVQKALGDVCNMNSDVLVGLCALLLPENSGDIEETFSAQAKKKKKKKVQEKQRDRFVPLLGPSEILEVKDFGVVDRKVLIGIPGRSAKALEPTEFDKPVARRDVGGSVNLVGELQIVPTFLG